MQFLELTYSPQLQPNPSRISYVDGTLTLDSPFTVEYDVYERNMDTNTGWEFIDTTVFKTLDIGDAHMVRVVPEGWKIRYGVDLAFPTREVNDNNPYYDSARDKTPSTYLAKEDESSNWNSVLRGSTIPLTELSESSTQASLEHSITPTKFFELWCDNIVDPEDAEKAGDNYELYGDGIKLSNLINFDKFLPSRIVAGETIEWIPAVSECVFEAKHQQFQTINGSETVKFYFNTGTNEIIGFLSNCGEIVYKIPINVAGTNIGFFYIPDAFFLLQNDALYHIDLKYTTEAQDPLKLCDVTASGHYLMMLPGGFATYDNGFKLYKAKYDYYILSDDKIHVLDDYDAITSQDVTTETMNPEHTIIWTSEDDRLQLLGLYRSEHQSLLEFDVHSRILLSENTKHNIESIERALQALGIDCNVFSTDDLHLLTAEEKTIVEDALDLETDYENLKAGNYNDAKSGLETSYADYAETSQNGIIDVLGNTIPKVIFGSNNPIVVSDELQIETFSGTSYFPKHYVNDLGVFVYGTKTFINVPPGDETKVVKLSDGILTANEDLSGTTLGYVKDGVEQTTALSFSFDGSNYIATLPDYDYNLEIYSDHYIVTDEVLYSFDGNTIKFSESATGYIVYDTSDKLDIDNISTFVFGMLDIGLKPEITETDGLYTLLLSLEKIDGDLYLHVNVLDNETIIPARGVVEIDRDGIAWDMEPLFYGPILIDNNASGTYTINVTVSEVYPFAGVLEYVNLTGTTSLSVTSTKIILHTTFLPLEFDAI